jgi:broad specificity polyphosphatase/5'/3'-nucleotidase SurE
MTGGAGYIALAAVIFGKGDPIRATLAARLFGVASNLLGVSSVCVSRQSDPPAEPDFGAAASVGAVIAAALRAARPVDPLVLSVNVPAAPASPEVVLTRLGVRPYAHGSVDPAHDDGVTRAYYLFGPPGNDTPVPAGAHGTDFAAIQADRISLTPLYVAPDVDDLPAAQQRLLTAVLAAVNGLG